MTSVEQAFDRTHLQSLKMTSVIKIMWLKLYMLVLSFEIANMICG